MMTGAMTHDDGAIVNIVQMWKTCTVSLSMYVTDK